MSVLPGLVPWMLLAAVAPPQAAPVATLGELGPALTACFQAPAGTAGSQLTVLFSLTSTGAVLGKPRVTFSHLVGRPQDRRAFVEAVLASLTACTPLKVTPGLGGAIAGRPLSIRFQGGGAARAI